ncbi:MAG: helix-turn-helix transcriptional regulator [Fibrobacter sp.]|nr:helix-turn-helix transcriptional regulator [Fibrobacter sp.]
MSDNAKEIFGKNLAFLLDRRGKNQIDVARDLDVATGTVSEWVRGKKYPRIDKIQALAEYLGVRMSILIEETGISTFKREEEETRLLNAFRKASDEIKAAALLLLETSAAERSAAEKNVL